MGTQDFFSSLLKLTPTKLRMYDATYFSLAPYASVPAGVSLEGDCWGGSGDLRCDSSALPTRNLIELSRLLDAPIEAPFETGALRGRIELSVGAPVGCGGNLSNFLWFCGQTLLAPGDWNGVFDNTWVFGTASATDFNIEATDMYNWSQGLSNNRAGFATDWPDSLTLAGMKFDSMTGYYIEYDVEIVPTPLPAGLPLLMGGLAAFAGFRRWGSRRA
ncbi:hypothetical protein JSE7799_02757 [Jannaschia seosinensis]|uniref:Uncharacterized protein n=1 Tax=Jannaschia seosinensis TaxID=313367 RepID=A0A0M7BD80_9RHOB|nr:VPLPA-CTERM sorting domain-containing protein [Jannaschia seosinensis]CUH40028.1 hypothetical protein JSE7799_02757 [Jannaschia seosinensis]